MSLPSVAIIGAGLSGLGCAWELSKAGAAVTVFEKSRSLGGRLATRRWEGHVVDHGAPWFSLTPALHRACAALLPAGPAASLLPVLGPDGRALPEPEGGRWYLPEGNNRLGKALAAGLDVRMETVVEAIEPTPGGRWRVAGGEFDALVLTAPWPQSRRLLEPWLFGINGPEPVYVRTLTAFFEYAGDPAASAWSAQEHAAAADASGLARTICENHKSGRVRPGSTVLVAHATPAFSAEYFEAEREVWSALLEPAVRAAWCMAGPPCAVFTHRWGFSTVEAPFAEPPARPDGIYLAGDAVAGSGIGAAFDSGVAVAGAVLQGL